jgi:type II secretory pathway component PulM
MAARRIAALFAPARAWYDELSTRDRRIVTVLGIVAVAGLCHVLLWQPARNLRIDAELRYANASRVLALMTANEAQLRGQGAAAAGDDRSLLSVAGRVAASEGISVTRFNPDSRGTVSLVIQEAPFDRVLHMLDVLARQHGIRVRQMALTRKDAGRVSASITLE